VVHRIDPILATVFGIHLWWYGLSYALGLFNAHLFVGRHRHRLNLSRRQTYDFSLLLAAGVLLGGRTVSVAIDWPFYRDQIHLVPAVWIGGFATHGLILGGAAGVLAFCLIHERPFREMFDALAVPAAVILGLGRVGNFIDGQIVGSVTSLPWGVQFPEAEGLRHPVVLYDGMKNLAIVPVLVWLRNRGLPPGRLAVLFLVLYAGLRIPIDLLRDYRNEFLGLGAGQTNNVIMLTLGLGLLAVNWWRWRDGWSTPQASAVGAGRPTTGLGWRRAVLAGLLLATLVIPSDAPRDVPDVYGDRHPGLGHSAAYPPLPDAGR
jgi:phosphatidylglycerol:prolipoprotein diacylglycerol transferase